ncbi:MAG: aminodeoxychorismate synthase component I, partial [Desulfobacterales bacterium]|nr:aminodeoxychorismate synthase component I [Desulfobacterales bacterium]
IDTKNPVSSGIFGYMSYDLKDVLEKLPRTSIDDLSLPDILLYAPAIIIVHDIKKDKIFLNIPVRDNNLYDDLDLFNRIISKPFLQNSDFRCEVSTFKSNFSKSRYIEAINKIKEYIVSGHVYQVNLAQRFETDFSGEPYSFFKTLYNRNPAPFFAFINASNHYIVSTSPERFILQNGCDVETRPIKGTRPRGVTELEDEDMRVDLVKSKKDDAELSMIVDLLRNDLGKVSRGGSVKVFEHKRIEAYQNVYHLISIVKGTLEEKFDSVDIIKATFPGGSITGCPKIRAMEIIDELEPNRRHIYTGSIGYISFHDTMDFSIAIRTATIYKEKLFFSVGGGIVFDSDPEKEYEETLHKGKTLMEVFCKKNVIPKSWIWKNGSLLPSDEANVSIMSQGFQYGYGFFETIRVDSMQIQYLDEHIERFYSTWDNLFCTEHPDLTWKDIIFQVIEKNGLSNSVAAVKIIAAKDIDNYNLIVTARSYTNRLENKKEKGLNLIVYPYQRELHLADHKTLNYLYYLKAGEWAKSKGYDEALILNSDGTVSETNTGNILLIKDKTVIIPISSHVLPGVMAKVVVKKYSSSGYRIEYKKLTPYELLESGSVFVTNSLMGMVPVLSIGKNK